MYRIGNLTFSVRNLTGDQSADRLIPFLHEGSQPDYRYELRFCRVLPLPRPGAGLIRSQDTIAAPGENGSTVIVHLSEGEPFAVTVERESCAVIYLPESSRDKSWHAYFLPDLLHLERPLLRKNCFVLHAVYAALDGNAILFTAPSGGGKSTQAGMWANLLCARIVNGDKAAVGIQEGSWFAHGLPVSGSSADCRNESHPVRAIVILEKAGENSLTRVGIAGFNRIFSQTVLNPWDGEFCGKAMDLVARACQEIPIYLFRCTKTPDAVHVLYRALFEKEEPTHGNEQSNRPRADCGRQTGPGSNHRQF